MEDDVDEDVAKAEPGSFTISSVMDAYEQGQYPPSFASENQ